MGRCKCCNALFKCAERALAGGYSGFACWLLAHSWWRKQRSAAAGRIEGTKVGQPLLMRWGRATSRPNKESRPLPRVAAHRSPATKK